MFAQVVERPLCFGLPAAETVHEDIYADPAPDVDYHRARLGGE